MISARSAGVLTVPSMLFVVAAPRFTFTTLSAGPLGDS
jgi:hypothetical protein